MYTLWVHQDITDDDSGILWHNLAYSGIKKEILHSYVLMKFYIEVVMILGNYIGPPSNQIELCYVAGELEAFLLQ